MQFSKAPKHILLVLLLGVSMTMADKVDGYRVLADKSKSAATAVPKATSPKKTKPPTITKAPTAAPIPTF